MDLLAESAEALFARHASPQQARAIRAGEPPAALWAALKEAGFLDALVPESAGGSGLSPCDVLPVLLAAGRHAVPMPVGETMVARAVLCGLGIAPPDHPIVLAEPPAGFTPSCSMVEVITASADVAMDDLDVAGAWVEATTATGAMQPILADTVRYSQDRRQFGRPIAAFQAIQQQVSVLAEEVQAATVACQLASIADGDAILGLSMERVAVAKIRVCDAAARISRIAHAVHGAMGVTEEVDLHLHTERLRLCRLRFGGEAAWSRRLAERFLQEPGNVALDFVRRHLGPSSKAEA